MGTEYIDTPTFFLEHVLTDRCNLSCKHCYKKRIDQLRTEMQPNELRQVYRRLEPCAVNMTGGEPLLIEGVISLAAELVAKGTSVGLQTNGLILNDVFMEQLKGVNIALSVDGYRETHRLIRGVDNFDKLIGLAKRYGNVKINCVIQEQNLDDIVDLAAFFQDNGIMFSILVENFITTEELEHDEKLFNKLGMEIITLPAKKKFQGREAQWHKTIEELFSKYPAFHFSLCDRHLENYFAPTNKDMKCQKIKRNRIRMGPDGSLFFCEHIGVVFGNVNAVTPEDVFQSAKFLRLKELLETEALDICKRCCKSR